MNIIQANFTTPNAKIAIVIARFNYFINEKLLLGALDVLERIGNIKNSNISIVKVPGALELPLITKNIIKLKKFDAIITLGTVIQGDTIHFQQITNTIYNILPKVSIKKNIPIIIGVLMTNNIQEAIDRSGGKKGNKGCEAAYTTLETLNLLKLLKQLYK